MNRIRLIFIALLVSIITGCGGGGGGGGGSSTAANLPGTSGAQPFTSGQLWSLVPATTPLTVSPVVDLSRQVVQDVTVTGGTLTTTAADGTVFTLTIPANALATTVGIAMAPVTLPSHPFGSGSAVGVQLLPDGLTFYNPVRLVITPASGAATPPLGQGLAITWTGTDNHVDLAFPAVGNGLSMDLLHFSSYATVSAQLGLTANLISQLGNTPMGRLSDAIAARIASDKRIAEGSTETPSPTDVELAALQLQFDTQQIPAMVASAGSSCAQGRSVISTLLALDRQNKFLGFGGGANYLAQVAGVFDTVANVCVEEEWVKCRDHHIIQDIVPASLGLERQLQLLGMDTTVSRSWQTKLNNYILQCHKFRIDYDSTSSTNSAPLNFSERMVASVTIAATSPDPLASRVTGQDVLTSMSYAVHYTDPCAHIVSMSPADSQLYISNLSWATNGGGPINPNAGELAYFQLDYFPVPNTSSHVIQGLCSTPPDPPITVTNWNYTAAFMTSIKLPDNSANPLYFNWWNVDFLTLQTTGRMLGPIIVSRAPCNGCAELLNTSVSFYNNLGGVNSGTVTNVRINHTPGP